MNLFSQIARDWKIAMNAADRTRVVLAGGLPWALSHFAWVGVHGDFWYYGPAPNWALFFWYGICAVDFIVAWLLLARPRTGIAPSFATMATTLVVNWTQRLHFPVRVQLRADRADDLRRDRVRHRAVAMACLALEAQPEVLRT